MKIKNSLLLITFVCLGACHMERQTNSNELQPLDYVNTLIGTNANRLFSHGNTYPAVTHPWGMNVWTPQTGKMTDNWVYTYQSDSIYGFRHTHTPSPWIGDYGSFTIMPVSGTLKVKDSERASRFFHSEETATPYYYSVHLDDYKIQSEITATERAGYLRFTFNKEKDNYIILDAYRQGSEVKIIPEENKIVGYTRNNSGGVADNFTSYFVMVFDTPFQTFGVWDQTSTQPNKQTLTGEYTGAYVQFADHHKQVSVKIASSYISPEQAIRNLENEIGNHSFDQMVSKSKDVWSNQLNRILVEGGTEEEKRTFYSNLYRVSLYPRQFFEYDENGNPYYYSVYDGKIYEGYMFTDNGFWDTFRSAHPFYTLMYPEMSEKLMQALISIYEEGGWLPNWISPGYRNSMIGAHAISLLNDAYSKGITNFDTEKALEAVHKESTQSSPASYIGRIGWKEYNTLGYIPYPNYSQAVATTLEYAYDDYCAMRLAEQTGKPEVAEQYRKRAKNYQNVYDSSTCFMRPKHANGNWNTPFDPYLWGGPYTEGNAIQYSWSVFHDVHGLQELMGGKEVFITMLDSVFTRPQRFGTYNRYFNEIAEMHHAGFAQYAHGNQPAQHVPYLYTYVGEPWKTQFWVRKIMDYLYNSTPNGYCGDEDNGQTSSWYLFSALGFYPVCPGSGEYILGTPLFNKVTLNLSNGNKFVIEAPDNSEKNRFIQEAKLNEEKYTKLYLKHEDIVKGGKIHFQMSSTPNKTAIYKTNDYPYSLSQQDDIH